MTTTGWSFSDVIFSDHSKLYLNSNTEIPFYSLITFPDGGLITSVNDLSKYLTELIKGFNGDGSILNKNSYTELFTKQLKPQNFTNQNGENEGIFVSFSSDGLIGHSGGDPGVSTHMFFNPKTQIGKILFVNTELDSNGKNDYNAILDRLSEFVKNY
jgi:CubicO group peptidase (beta-lactamase class C family)